MIFPREGIRIDPPIPDGTPAMTTDFDTTVKLTIYRAIAETGGAPDSGNVASATGFPESEVRAAFTRLHAKRLLVPEPGDPTRIRMAPPFSGIPTPFPVDALGKRYYANCVWDAYGIPAALHADAVAADVLPSARGLIRDGLLIPSS